MKKDSSYLSVLLAVLMVTIAGEAECRGERNGDDERNFDFAHNRGSISGLLTSSYTWQIELGYHYMFNRFFGVGGSIGTWKVYFEEGWASGSNWEIESDDNKPFNLFLRPSLILKSPAVGIGQVDLGLFAEPGVMMNIPYTCAWVRQDTQWPEYELNKVSTSGGQWLGLDLRAGVYANIGQLGISAGYLISNFDVYSQQRHLSYRGVSFSQFYPHKPLLQGAYLTLSYYF